MARSDVTDSLSRLGGEVAASLVDRTPGRGPAFKPGVPSQGLYPLISARRARRNVRGTLESSRPAAALGSWPSATGFGPVKLTSPAACRPLVGSDGEKMSPQRRVTLIVHLNGAAHLDGPKSQLRAAGPPRIENGHGLVSAVIVPDEQDHALVLVGTTGPGATLIQAATVQEGAPVDDQDRHEREAPPAQDRRPLGGRSIRDVGESRRPVAARNQLLSRHPMEHTDGRPLELPGPGGHNESSKKDSNNRHDTNLHQPIAASSDANVRPGQEICNGQFWQLVLPARHQVRIVGEWKR